MGQIWLTLPFSSPESARFLSSLFFSLLGRQLSPTRPSSCASPGSSHLSLCRWLEGPGTTMSSPASSREVSSHCAIVGSVQFDRKKKPYQIFAYCPSSPGLAQWLEVHKRCNCAPHAAAFEQWTKKRRFILFSARTLPKRLNDIF